MSDVTDAGRLPRWDRRDLVGLAIVLGVLALPVIGLLRYQGPPMEEGFMLAFPEQLLQGRYPHKDFLHLYGPGSLWVLAAVYRVFGTHITVERIVGLVQHATVAVALYSLIRPFGRRIATAGGVVAVLVLLVPAGLAAMAWNGALALGLSALAVGAAGARAATTSRSVMRNPGEPPGVTSQDAGRNRRAMVLLALSGVLAGGALLYRPDLAIAMGLGVLALAWPLDRRHRTPLLAGAAATVALYGVHLLLAGPAEAIEGMFVEPVFTLRPGRTLPVPPSWDHIDGFLQRAGALRTTGWPLPMPELSHQIVFWFWMVPLSIAVSLLAAWVLWRRDRDGERARSFIPAALFGTALITQALQRPDTTHLAWVSCVTFPLAMAAMAHLVSVWRDRWPSWAPDTVAIGGVALAFVVLVPFYPLRTYVDSAGQTFGVNRFGFPVRNGDRVFYFGSREGASDAQRVADVLAERSRPGERLVVGPTDLSRTNYNDAFFYHLFPDLLPGTRYIEMDPGIADAEGSGLARELRASDWLVLSDAASAWEEPNTSAESRSGSANEVVEREWCEVVRTDTFRLLENCAPNR